MTEILNLYKPKGITSHDLVDQVRKKYPGKKVGHAGSLDPLAEGVILIGIGEGTKRLGELANLDKEYIGKIAFGIESETDDLDSPNLKGITVPSLNQKLVKEALAGFRGKIDQKVPLYSATHYRGRKLYKRARKGEKIPYNLLPKKSIRIDKIELIRFDQEGFLFKGKRYPLIEIKVVCSSGTYIRSLARDLGLKLKTRGILVELIRTRIGEYQLDQSEKI